MSIASTGLGDEGRRGGAIKPLAVSVNTAAVLSGFSPSKIWSLIKNGDLRVSRIGKRTLIIYSSLEALIHASESKPARRMPNRWAMTKAAAKDASPDAA
jgi:fucose 4-O-acetylase-like acetyltransferase